MRKHVKREEIDWSKVNMHQYINNFNRFSLLYLIFVMVLAVVKILIAVIANTLPSGERKEGPILMVSQSLNLR
jgi:hypothetical protein